MKTRMIAVLLVVVMLCGCSSREDELQSEIDELKSKLEERDEKSSSGSGSDDEDPDKQESLQNDGNSSTAGSVYDGIDWDSIPEAPASDFGYRIYYGDYAEDLDFMSGYDGDGSEFVKSIFIFDYYGHDKYVKIPEMIDGLPVALLGSTFPDGEYLVCPWDRESERVHVYWDNSVFRGTGVESVFISKRLTRIAQTAFDDCPTLKSISADLDNPAYFSEDGVLFTDGNVGSASSPGGNALVYTRLPEFTYVSTESGYFTDLEILDEGEWEMKTPECIFYNICYTDSSLSKFKLDDSRVIKFTDGTYGAYSKVTGKYIPIREDQFKRDVCQTIFRYPEGKRDKSYTVKKREWTTYDEDGGIKVNDGYAWLGLYWDSNSSAFYNAQYLKKLEFENGIKQVGWVPISMRKEYLSGLEVPIGIEEIVIPASLICFTNQSGVEEEGYHSNLFWGLTKLKEYKVDKGNPVFKSVDGALLSKDGKILYSVPCKIGENYTVPDGVEAISPSAFVNSQDMTITIPASVKYLGLYSLDETADSTKVSRNASVFYNSSDITLNVSSKTEIRDIFEDLPEICEVTNFCTNLIVNFVD